MDYLTFSQFLQAKWALYWVIWTQEGMYGGLVFINSSIQNCFCHLLLENFSHLKILCQFYLLAFVKAKSALTGINTVIFCLFVKEEKLYSVTAISNQGI